MSSWSWAPTRPKTIPAVSSGRSKRVTRTTRRWSRSTPVLRAPRPWRTSTCRFGPGLTLPCSAGLSGTCWPTICITPTTCGPTPMRRSWSVASSGSRRGCSRGSTRPRAPTTKRRGAISATPTDSCAVTRRSKILAVRSSSSSSTTTATRRRWPPRFPVAPRRSSSRWPTSSARPAEPIAWAPSCMPSAGPCTRWAARSSEPAPSCNCYLATSVDPVAASTRCVDTPTCRGRPTTPSWPVSCRAT